MAHPEYTSNQIVGLVKDFIRIPSVTGNREAMRNALNRSKTELEGFACEEFTEPNSGSESILFFNTPTRPKEFRIILNGHLDVVSGKRSQFEPYIKDNELHGRGSCDMKGGAAVEMLVFKSLARNLPYPIGLQLVTDEETGGLNGTGYQIAQGVKSEMVISGEPTNLNISNEQKGILVFEITSHGKSAHAAYPHRGDNAVLKIAKLVTDLSEVFPVADGDKWATTLNVAGIYTPNRGGNKVPDMATALFDFRNIPDDDKEDLESLVKQLSPGGITLNISKERKASCVDPSHPDLKLLMNCIESVTGQFTNFVKQSGGSDSAHYAEAGSVSVDFGPSGKGLHSDMEYGIIESYQQYAQILTSFLKKLE